MQKRYDIGKAPARVALIQLEHENILQNMGRKGHVIRPVTIKDIRNIFQLRLFLEPSAARFAAGMVDTEKLAELDAVYTALIHENASGKKNFREIHKANKNFHLEIAKSLGNDQLMNILNKLYDMDMRINYLMLKSFSDLEHWNFDHKDIRDALEKNDGALAEKMAHQHTEKTQTQLMSYIMRLPNLANVNIAI